jgi:hypothetical protein
MIMDMLIHDHSLPHRILVSTMTTTNGTYTWSFITTHNNWFNHDYEKWKYFPLIVVIVEPSILCGNEWSWICFLCRSHGWTNPWSFIATQNTWFNYDYDKRNISMIIHYHTEYLVQSWLRQTKHIHDHFLPHRILGSTMTTTNGMVIFRLS